MEIESESLPKKERERERERETRVGADLDFVPAIERHTSAAISERRVDFKKKKRKRKIDRTRCPTIGSGGGWQKKIYEKKNQAKLSCVIESFARREREQREKKKQKKKQKIDEIYGESEPTLWPVHWFNILSIKKTHQSLDPVPPANNSEPYIF